ncbi:hypothetical protein FCV43_18080 [Vibrio genomosp. F6]|uniref:Uncharacterized protein n=1 Tax=Vibrio genomosp. F6 TaxID=723172 RepID=A0A0H3ZT93_9VIBR|nr:hypothetical protein [Vibrio genomosp. F6]AKN39500.1 hypothetical protein [Vibrio genomosp. F6]TKF16673.1 hypothetical protein FCV43_18080 [Vibrio genomosp. F6]
MSSLVSLLMEKHRDILLDVELKTLFQDENLSGLFLASPHKSYESSSCKLMIVGQETRSWRNRTCHFKNEYSVTDQAVLESMECSSEFNTKAPKRSRFRQFYKKSSVALNSNSLDPENAAVWANQFCVSHYGKSPVKAPSFKVIEYLSAKLLRAQFEVLKPNVAIFTVGSARDQFIKDTFHELETQSVIHPRRLWHFKIGDTHCFRTNHPRWSGSKRYIDEALALAKEVCTSP